MDSVLKIWRALAALFVLVLLASPGSSVTAQAEESLKVHITQVDTSEFPRVKVYISVTDDAGEPVPIHAEQIVITEDGRNMQVQEAQGVGDSQPPTTLLVMDLSGSMAYAGKLEAAQAAALAYVDQMRSGEEAGLLSFNTEIIYVQPITSDRATLKAAIEGLKTKENNTALYDALVKAVEILQNVSGRKAIVALTDGMDNSSQSAADEVIKKIGPAGLSISTIGMGDLSKGQTSYAGLDEAALKSLASQAGGNYGYANDPASLRALYEQFSRVLHSEYVVTYISPATLRDGVNRSLGVSFSRELPAQAGETSYNPGGLVPEIAQPASWPLFLLVLAVLLVLLFLPVGIRQASALAPAILEKAKREPSPKPRIRLQETRAPRIKLH